MKEIHAKTNLPAFMILMQWSMLHKSNHIGQEAEQGSLPWFTLMKDNSGDVARTYNPPMQIHEIREGGGGN